MKRSRGVFRRMLREWIKVTLLAICMFLVVRAFLVESSFIPTSSMESTLLVGDFLLVNKALYGAGILGTQVRLPAVREPARGDVVVFRPPHDPHRNYVKRVVGVPGDTLEMQGKRLFLNGVLQEEPFALFTDGRGDAIHPDMAWQSDYLAAAGPGGRYVPSRDNWGPIVVPPERFFVLGDNRDNSEDSRYWGFVDRRAISGSPWIIYLSVAPSDVEESDLWARVRWRRMGRMVP